MLVVDCGSKAYALIEGEGISKHYSYTLPPRYGGRKWLCLVEEALRKAIHFFPSSPLMLGHKSMRFPSYITDAVVESTAMVRYNHDLVKQIQTMLDLRRIDIYELVD